MRLLKSLLVIAAATLATSAQASFVPVGIQTDVTMTQVQNWGWTVCYQDNGNGGVAVSDLFSTCNGAYLMFADSLFGSDDYEILAAAKREDVLLDTGDSRVGSSHTANGAEWYYSANWSMGYAELGSTVDRYSCDINLAGWNGITHQGSCWHSWSDGIQWGWGYNKGAGYNGTQTRTILMANSADGTVPEPGTFALLGLGLLGLGVAGKRRANKAA
jgi:hypothetical protein